MEEDHVKVEIYASGDVHMDIFQFKFFYFTCCRSNREYDIKPNSIVHSIIYDEDKGKATGVRVLDSETLEMTEYYAKIIFLNASTVNSTLIMLNSKSNRFENGFGNDSGELGHNMMDHHFKAGARAKFDGYEDSYYYGNRPNSGYLGFRNLRLIIWVFKGMVIKEVQVELVGIELLKKD